jgi:hypothetical protein
MDHPATSTDQTSRGNRSCSPLIIETVAVDSGGWPTLAGTWNHLFSQRPDASAYVSPIWMQTWLQIYGDTLRPDLFVAKTGENEPVGICLLTRRTRYAALLPHVRIHLNCDGESAGQGVVVQHNSILSSPVADESVMLTLARHICSSRVDEIAVSGFNETGLQQWIRAFPGWTAETDWREDHYVDLDQLRATGSEYISLLSRNTREQLRRSLKRYRERGDLHLETATTGAQADAMLDELIALHDTHWRSKGHAGGFANDWRRSFHRSYIRAALPHGEVQLLRVTAGGETIGVLYNLVANGKVCFYQSGLRYETDGHFKPGLVVHHLAIMHCLRQGMSEYDFLVSGPNEGRYKSSLSTHHRRLGWLTLYRPGWRRQYFSLVRSLRHHLAKKRHNASPSENTASTTALPAE